MSDDLFTTRMRKATRKVHTASDALVNAKIAFALYSDSVWGEILLIFYEIFKFLESVMQEKTNERIGKLYVKEIMNRTAAFEKDLDYYLGPTWKENYQIRESVKNYLNHLQHLLETDSDLLMPYVYHLYMGLLSGGQILKKKRQLQKLVIKLENHTGEAVTDFEAEKVSYLKSVLRNQMNLIAEDLDETKKEMLIEESIKVFELNNSIIRTMKGVDCKTIKKKMFLAFIIILLIVAFMYYGKCLFAEKTFKMTDL